MRYLPAVLVLSLFAPAGAVLPAFDFTKAETCAQWQAQHDISALRPTPEGLAITISGDDPYMGGPPRDYPTGQPLWLSVRLKAAKPGMAQVFWSTASKGPNETDSVRFPVQGRGWEDVRVPVPPLGPGTSLRFDPPGGEEVTLASIAFAERPRLAEPAWPKPFVPQPDKDAPTLSSGPLTVTHSKDAWGAFTVRVNGSLMAVGDSRALIGTLIDDKLVWLDVAALSRCRAETSRLTDGSRLLSATSRLQDPGGAEWTLTRVFLAGKDGALTVHCSLACSKPREVVYWSPLTLFAGAGSYGEGKKQALFAGLEYLDRDEPSSSEKDLRGAQANRQVPWSYRVTMPLMTVCAADRYVALTWKPSPDVCAVFDSPDRLFKSGGSLMGLLVPGSAPDTREENRLLPYFGVTAEPDKPLNVEAAILGGMGADATAAVRQYVAVNPPSPMLEPAADWPSYVRLAAAGWLDSKAREGNLFRHAWPGSFAPMWAADAALWCRYLALQTDDATLKTRLNDLSAEAIKDIPPAEYSARGVGHVHPPIAPLVFGHPIENALRARNASRESLKRFEPDGRLLYKRDPDRPDYGSTHFEKDANGLTANVVAGILDAAMQSGDRSLLKEGLRLLHALDRFDGTVPRGAQTWEVPLHTPDILASANLVRAYTLGYEATGDAALLSRAKYWAWTGVPFVYLVKPAPGPVGRYAAIAVLGATNWEAPNWLGLPVQWCGLVYADALNRLARSDPKGPWRKLADGIALSGVQQTFATTEKDRQGLLPDSSNLLGQVRNDPAINPATLLPVAIQAYGRPAPYMMLSLRKAGVFLQAPCKVTGVDQTPGRVAFTVEGWPDGNYYVLLSGLAAEPKVTVDGAAAKGEFRRDGDCGLLAIRLRGRANVVVDGIAPSG